MYFGFFLNFFSSCPTLFVYAYIFSDLNGSLNVCAYLNNFTFMRLNLQLPKQSVCHTIEPTETAPLVVLNKILYVMDKMGKS